MVLWGLLWMSPIPPEAGMLFYDVASVNAELVVEVWWRICEK